MELKDCKIGQRVYVLKEPPNDWDNRGDSEEAEAARYTYIVAFYANTPVVYKPISLGGYNAAPDINEGWRIAAECLMPLPDASTFPKVYPQQCKKCKSPARKVGTKILCSKDNCKTKYDFKKDYKAPYRKSNKELDPFGFVICPTCSARAVSITSATQVDQNNREVMCGNHHTWWHVFEENQRLIHGGRKYIFRKHYFHLEG